MKKYQPCGSKLLVLPTGDNQKTTEGKIIQVDLTLTEATVVEVGHDVQDIYKKGDTVIMSQKAGVAHYHNGKQHLWVSGAPHPQGDIWAVVNETKKK